MSKPKWAGTTFGNDWMHKSLIKMLKVIDIRVLYIFVAIFVLPICLLVNKSGIITYRFFRKRIGYGKLKSVWNTYINHIQFSQVVIDKFAMWAGKKFEIEIEGYEHFLSLANKPEGFIQLSSHIGNYEIAGYSLVAEQKRLNALVFWGEKQSVIENRKRMFVDSNINMIAVRPDMGHLFEIDKAINDGEIVSIPSDRIFGSPKSLLIQFLNGEANFPVGPFSVATMRGLDVIAVNVMKVNTRKYKIYVTPLNYDRHAKRKEQIVSLAKLYISELERMMSMYPTQWYNYFDLWKN